MRTIREIVIRGYRSWRTTVYVLYARDCGYITSEECREMLNEQ